MVNLSAEEFFREVFGSFQMNTCWKNFLHEYNTLCYWLGYPVYPVPSADTHGDGEVNQWESRFAPSVIARSDAALLGLSSPRFALRVYPRTDAPFFVNFRRVREVWFRMTEETRECFVSAAPNAIRYEWDNWNDEIKQQNGWRLLQAMGDCYLEEPERYRQYFKLCSRHLALDFGECLPGEPQQPGTVFIRFFDAVGQCGHASAFMAACIHEHADAVHGLHEISYFSSNESEESNSFPITPLTMGNLEEYGEKIGLRGSLQIALNHDDVQLRSQRCKYAIRGYLNSKIPVITIVDLNRLNGYGSPFCNEDPGKSIHELNNTPIWTTKSQHDSAAHQLSKENQPSESHFLTIIGCSKKASSGVFIIHDPGSYPYLQIRSEKLLASRPYYKGASGDSTMIKLHDPSFVVYHPDRVKLPLLCQYVRSEQGEMMRLGILDYLELMEDVEFGEFILIKTSGARRKLIGETWHGLDRILLSRAANACDKYFLMHGERWVWIQIKKDSFCIWDAEQALDYEVTDRPNLRHFSRLILVTSDNN